MYRGVIRGVRWGGGLGVHSRRGMSFKGPLMGLEKIGRERGEGGSAGEGGMSWKLRRLLDFAKRGSQLPTELLEGNGRGYLWIGRHSAAWPFSTMPVSDEEMFRPLPREEVEEKPKVDTQAHPVGMKPPSPAADVVAVVVEETDISPVLPPSSFDGEKGDGEGEEQETVKGSEGMEMRQLKNAVVRRKRKEIIQRRRKKEVIKIIKREVFPKPKRKKEDTVIVPARNRDE